jgi:sortase A
MPQPRIRVNARALWRALELLAWMTAVVCLSAWTFAVVSGSAGRREALRQFAAMKALGPPDQRLWSPERIRAWDEAQKQPSTPLAILRIRRLGLEVPILEGTDDSTLNRAAGHIADTAAPGADGNCGIAAHRDGYFRPLKDVEVGDVLEIETPRGSTSYRIERTWIVGPDDVSVLDPTPVSSVTLVTCYPFYFVGSAPQRFIVRAVRAAS